MKARPPDGVEAIGVRERRSAEQHLEVDVLATPFGPGRLDMMHEKPETDLVA
jgi:hypothetical protein